jgi:uncharacterized protein with ParB-like and HNH nuclease domain
MTKTLYLIENLPIIFRRIDSGEIHIPQFQRPFVWSRQNIIQLFESIYNGLPIGTFLFWRSIEKNLTFSQDDFIAHTKSEEHTTYMYVIDGTQRLRALYNCLHKSDTTKNPQYWVGFDLEQETFVHLDNAVDSEIIVSLSSIFSPEKILNKQIALASQNNKVYFIKTFNKLVSAFVDYQIPIIVIDKVTEDELITVFERLNTRGVSLSKEEILRARRKT